MVREQLRQPVAGRVLDLPSVHVGCQLVGLVEDHEVPLAAGYEDVDLLVTGKAVEGGDGEVVVQEGVAARRDLEGVAREDGEVQAELVEELVLPLHAEAPRADHEAPFEVTAGHHLLDEKPGHDGFSRAGIIGEDVP